MNKNNYIYFFISILAIFIIIYGGFLYDIYIHPTVIIDELGNKDIVIFGDLKYVFKIINCNNLGFDVYTPNKCYRDYYGSFLYGPSILVFPTISKNAEIFLTYLLTILSIISFVYLNIKIINPRNFFGYFIITVILFNPTTLFLYEKMNIDIFIYISLVLLVYYFKSDIIKIFLIFILTLTKFYPAILSIIFLLKKDKIFKGFFYFLFLLCCILLFIFFYWDNILSVFKTLDYVSQSLKYSFSLNTLNKIFIYLTSLGNVFYSKLVLISSTLIISFVIFYFFSRYRLEIENQIGKRNTTMFILSSSLSVSLYLLFGNNFYREIYLIGIIPFILSNSEIKFFKNLLYFYIFKYLYLLVVFPYYYNSDLKENITAQIFVSLKSFFDLILIIFLISILFTFFKIYIDNLKKVKNEL